MEATSKLFEPIKVGDLELKHRIVMAPLTRTRADPETGIPNDLMKEYYSQRSGFSLIITECSQVSPLGSAFPGSGAIYSEDQMKGWKNIVDAVHAKGSKIFLQIWHGGRNLLKEFIGGETPLAPSAIACQGVHYATKTPYPVPKEMTEDDIKTVIEEFKQGAILAKKAGFDGVELHAANGYLVDEFLRDGSNKRTDKYGGSIENRCRFMLEVMDVLIEVFGNKRVAIRFSPTGRYGDMYDSNPIELMKYALKELEKRDIAFVEIKRHGNLDAYEPSEKTTDEQGRTLPQVQMPKFFEDIRPLYNGILIGNDGLNPQSAEELIKNGTIDLVSFGTLSISNPDLVSRIKNNQALNNEVDWVHIHQGGATGYTDYPFYLEKEA